ncbi:helix-turn-helix domain-containing protein [Globicatella sanguinis]|uniref:helix-turn-helix domain-containing protein n=1 Tax=Globicatella sanguinis TaxID=13076 RepID=UPI000824E0C3|nr:helix-turn-helix domain-containing protein [Globicatella sanguinis]MDK7630560.1 helix-turn-helix domain-containing protein [Globicatella sanguinis]WIK66728.1 helix-turn-helix domain-containing protein [Globicatella sanguinis]WKT56133.1 helix-turn-helix domain-containing protein [Globicatella sanguinis]
MDIWILVIALLAIAIVLLIASIYAKDDQNIEKQLEEFQIQQSRELYNIKTRVAEIEQELKEPSPLVYGSDQNYPNETVTDEEQLVEEVEVVDTTEISELTKEEVIRLYSQGFTMQEIAADVALNVKTVQTIVDDYIENR